MKIERAPEWKVYAMDFTPKKKIASKALRVYSIKQAGQDPMRYYDLHKGTCRETLDAWNQLYTGPSKWKLVKDVEKISYNKIAVILVTVNVWHCQGCKFWKIRM